jgi:hypothetical protein
LEFWGPPHSRLLFAHGEQGESKFRRFRQCAARDEKPANGLATWQTRSRWLQRKQERNSLRLTERRANVYENKGSLWKTRGRGGNVYEKKGTYTTKTGMFLKIKVVNR